MTSEQIEKLKSLVEEKIHSVDSKSFEFKEWDKIFWELVGMEPNDPLWQLDDSSDYAPPQKVDTSY